MDFRIFRRVFQTPFILSLLIFLSVMGPGIITANVDNDAGGVTTYSLAGSQFGYDLMWLFIPMFVALAVIQEMGVRLGIVSGKGLADLIRERVGLKITVILMFALLFTNFGNVLAEFSGVAVSTGIFNIPRFIALPIAAHYLSGSLWLKVIIKALKSIFISVSSLYILYCSRISCTAKLGPGCKKPCNTTYNFKRRVHYYGCRSHWNYNSSLANVLHPSLGCRERCNFEKLNILK